ncbi:MAG TPA: hypothetical protein VMS31_06115, partial [Pyrinomonadaceae bacterium]|nr:hypothetical protein [Pyrinomonadaceae bacterium]
EGKVELFINGDFLEFAQVKPDVYTLGSSTVWCSESESMEKLDAILKGHADIFEAMKRFQANNNRVTLAAGNHDVDLYWPRVQDELRRVGGPIEFATGSDNYFRYDNRLMIGHGHMIDPANRFANWDNPILDGPDGTKRLEMCPGTLFMVKFVNWLEKDYPFSDNLKPITALARVLWNEQRASLVAAAKILFKFAGTNPMVALGMGSNGQAATTDIAHVVRVELATNEDFKDHMVELYREVRDPNATVKTLEDNLKTEGDVFEFLKEVMAKASPEKWQPAFDILEPATLGTDEFSLQIVRSGMAKDKEDLQEEARSHLLSEDGPEVVVFGHTHQPDEWRGRAGKSAGGYFNPGSWTRYVDASKMQNLRLDDLKNETDFPYQLNYIRIEQSQGGGLAAEKICVEEQNGDKFSVVH